MGWIRMMGLGGVVLIGAISATGQDTKLERPKTHFERPGDAAVRVVLPRTVSRPPSRSFLTVGPFTSVQVNVDNDGNNIVGDAANEPSLAIDPLDPDVIVIGWRQFDDVRSNFRQSGVAYTHDAGLSWTSAGPLWPGHFGSDPSLGADALGNFYYSAIGFDAPGVRLFRSFDGGVNWDGPIEILEALRDKQWLTIDQTDGMGSGHFYMTWTAGQNFTRSSDGGLSWDAAIHAPLNNPVWGTLSVGHDGALYLVDQQFAVAVSHDAQDWGVWPSTFDIQSHVDLGGVVRFSGTPNPGGLLGQPWIVTDRSDGPTRGMVYVLCSVRPADGDPVDVRMARSSDGGQTWSESFRVNDDPQGNFAWQWFGTLSLAPSGRLDAVWYDTRNSGQATISEVFYAYSTNRGRTWSQNMQASPAFDSTIGWPNQNKIGDYITMFSDDLGAGVAYAATFNGEQDVYFLRIALDCNGNGLHDGDDIASGRSSDNNFNGIPDECECDPCDTNCDGDINAFDIEPFLDCLFEACDPCNFCVGDVNRDGVVNAFDIEPFLNCLFP